MFRNSISNSIQQWFGSKGHLLSPNQELLHNMQFIFSFLIIFTYFHFNQIYFFNYYKGYIGIDLLNWYTLSLFLGCAVLGYCFVMNDASCMKKFPALILLLFSTFILTAGGWVVMHRLFGDGLLADANLFFVYARSVFKYIMLFLAGFYFKPHKWPLAMVVCFILVFLNVMINTDWDRLVLDLSSLIDPGRGGYYQQISRNFLITGLIAWSAAGKLHYRLGVLIMMVVPLYVIGSRPDFWFFIALLPVILWLTLQDKRKYLFSVFGLFALFAGALLAFQHDIIGRTRQLGVLSPSSDGSFQLRQELFEWGIKRITESPVFGDYGGVLVELGSIGNYIHNLLSVWQAFGLFPFLLYTALVVIATFFACALIVKKGLLINRYYQLVAVFSLMATLQVLFARSFGWGEIALAWGLVAGAVQHEGSNYDLWSKG